MAYIRQKELKVLYSFFSFHLHYSACLYFEKHFLSLHKNYCVIMTEQVVHNIIIIFTLYIINN